MLGGLEVETLDLPQWPLPPAMRLQAANYRYRLRLRETAQNEKAGYDMLWHALSFLSYFVHAQRPDRVVTPSPFCGRICLLKAAIKVA